MDVSKRNPLNPDGTTMTRKAWIGTFLILLTVGLQVGCASHSLPVDHSPETLGKIGAQIDQNPDRKSAILSEHNLTEEKFRRAVRQIAEDPALSERYHDKFQSVRSNS